MTLDLETRRRRAQYRAFYRGTREMDWLMGKYAEAHVGDMDCEALDRFEHLLSMPDPDLQRWIMSPEAPPENAVSDLILALRAFHRVTPQPDES